MHSSFLKPIYALADSRLLFWRRPGGTLFLDDLAKSLVAKPASAAYIGASNGDDLSAFHEIFEPAMQQIEIGERRMILTRPSPADGAFLERATLIVLAGGSVETGWRAFEDNGFKDLIQRRRYEGASLIGISAGAVQLGRGGLTDNGSELLTTFGLLPFYLSTHDERSDWASLRKVLTFVPDGMRGIGIPSGGGIVYDGEELTPLCKPIFELHLEGDRALEASLVPHPE